MIHSTQGRAGSTLLSDTSAKITRVETIPLRVPFKKTHKFSGGSRPDVEVLLVKIHSNQGIFGVGETQAWRRLGSAETLPKLVEEIENHLAPRMVGRCPFEINAIMHSLNEALDHSLYAQAALGDAIYDLQGKLLNVPVHRLLGGQCRDAVTACAVLSVEETIEGTLEHLQELYDNGFRTFAMKVGADPDADVINVRAIMERFADKLSLRVDANAILGFDDALELLTKLEPFHIDGAEQPLAPWDIEGMAELARRLTIPLIADEALVDEHALINIIRRRAATGLQTKEAKHGGIWHIRKHWMIAEAAGMRIYPGSHPSLSVATAAVVQLAAAWPGHLCEGPFAYGVSGVLADDIVIDPIKPKGNQVRVPEGPGLSVTLDEDKIKRFRIDGQN